MSYFFFSSFGASRIICAQIIVLSYRQGCKKWLNRLGVKILFIELGSPWENSYIESFNGKLRDEVLSREIFTTLEEDKVLIEQWRNEYNQVRLRSSLGYQPSAPETILTAATT